MTGCNHLAFAQARRPIKVRFEVGTVEMLRNLLTLGVIAVHFSGHGGQGFLCMEDACGGAHNVSDAELGLLVRSHARDGNTRLQFVFVSACFSEAVAHAFVTAGVPHVVAIRANTQVSDKVGAQTINPNPNPNPNPKPINPKYP